MKRRAAYTIPAVWALSFGAWIVISLLNAGSEVIDVITGDLDFSMWEPIAWEMTSVLSTALLAPFVIEVALRVRLSTTGRTVAVVGHLAAMIVFSLLHVTGMVTMRKALYAVANKTYDFGNLGLELLYEGFKDAMTYATIIGLTYGFDYYLRYRKRELQAATLQASLARANLENLEHRIQPHFLFNTLNMISATMHENVDRADRMLTRLSDLLRMSVQRRGRQEVPLAEELEMLAAYVEIMQARFEKRLEVTIDAAPGAERALVPPLLLQPLVENAIKHGVASDAGGGRVEIRIHRDETRLRFEVRDDGPGAGEPTDALLRKGQGLALTAERLAGLYGTEQGLELADAETGGFALSVWIPFRE